MNYRNIFTIIPLLSSLFVSYNNFIIKPGIPSQTKIEQRKVSGAFDALNFFSLARTYPNDQISDNAYSTAFKEIKMERLSKSKNPPAVDPWTAIGPHNTGGRTLAVAFNPQNPSTVYAGSASGGLWVSHTGGEGVDAWHRIETGFPVLGVSSIEIEPNDSNVIYIGTGEIYNYFAASTGAAYRNTRGTYGIGILKSTDGGATWAKSLDWSYNEQRGVWAVKMNPLNHNTVWAATTEGTYRSYDAGATWKQVHLVVMANDLVINPVDTSIVITGNGNFASNGFGIYRTSDGGNSWRQITSGLPTYFEGKIQLDIYKANPNIVYASIGHGFLVYGNNPSWLCKSIDAGENWTIMTQQDYSKWQGWYSHDLAVNQSNPDELLVIGIEIYKSINSGATITQQSISGLVLGRPPIGGPEDILPTYVHSDAHDVKQHPTDPNTYYLGTDGCVFRTTDFGQTFESLNGRYQTAQFYNGTSSSKQDSLFFIGGLQDNGTVIYDGSLAWIRKIGGDGSKAAVDASNDNIIYCSWQNLNIRKSTNRGGSFSGIVTPPDESRFTAFIAPYRIFHFNSDIIYAGRDYVYKPTTGGSSWTTTNNNTILDGLFAIEMDISYQSPDKAYVATAPSGSVRGNVYYTNNGGNIWIDITGPLPDRFPADIAVDPINDDIVYIAYYGFGSGHVFKSKNSGAIWIDITGTLPDLPTIAVIVDPNNSNHVYVGNDLGVNASTDGGKTWQDFSDGLPSAVIAMDLNITVSNNVLRVATHGNGVYERKLLSTVISSTPSDKTLITNFRLEQNYPNPFNPGTKIRFRIPEFGFVSLKVYDVLGNLVTTLLNENKPEGNYEVDFDGSNSAGGTYFYRLQTATHVETKKMILLK